MGVPGFYSWLTKRYPLIKHMVSKHSLPSIDYLYLDMNGIIYKCVKDNTLMFKDQLKPKEWQKIWIQIFNYINMIVNVLKPNKMIMMGLDGVAPRSKMNNQRARRFKSSKDHAKRMEQFRGFSGDEESQENFKNNSISPGTKFMTELNAKLNFFIQKKIEEDDYWRTLSIVFTGSDVPGEGEHKIMEFIRANAENFDPQDSHCLYGADADLIMLAMTLPIKNLCIIREEFIPSSQHVKIIESKKDKLVNFELIFISILREYFHVEYSQLQSEMSVPYDLPSIMKDFVFLFFLVGNDFLPRCMAYNIRESSIENMIVAFKQFLKTTSNYVVGSTELNMKAMGVLLHHVSSFQAKFLVDRSNDVEKRLESKKEFQDQLNERMHEKIKYEESFLLKIKTHYLNREINDLQLLYYQSKFMIDPAQQPDQFYNILIYYLYGLQFVYEYYFINLPSWQWYYPYYYAPLLCDFSLYINHLASNNFKLERLQPGTPFQPFKQLMCILPKQSNELLPESFRHFLTDKESLLRNPIDFYPDEFHEDLYGSTRQFQAILLIPFLDLMKVEEAYQIAIKQVSEEELVRNKFSKSILYEYSEKAKEIMIQSPISLIQSTRCTINKTYVDIWKSFKWKNQLKQIKHELLRMPTFTIKHYYSSQIKKKNNRSSYLIFLTEENRPEKKIKLGDEIFYGFPLEHSGMVQASISYDEFMSIGSFDGSNYYLDNIGREFTDVNVIKMNKSKLFIQLMDRRMREDYPEIDLKKTKQLFFVKDTMSFIRCQNGKFKRAYIGTKYPTYTIVPAEIVTNKKLYENTKDQVQFLALEEEFKKGEDVLVFPQANGKSAYKAKVTGHDQKNMQVKVRIIDTIKPIPEKVLKDIVHTRDLYFTLKFCAFLTKIKFDILLTLLDSIPILLEQPGLPPSIDIGLNFISRQEEKLVTNIVRINYDSVDSKQQVQKGFSRLEISMKGLQLIIAYKEQFPEIFKFIEERHEKLIENRSEKGKINWREPIKLSEIYREEKIEKATKSLMGVYFWLVKKDQTHMPLSSVYSKQISIKKIVKLQEFFQKMNEKKNKKYMESQEILVDPNFIFSRRLAELGSFGLSSKPKTHTIRDQVLCLKPELFGDYGVVIGVDNDKYEVLFQKPSFGKSNLNGLTSDLWAGKFYERQLFNLDIYPEFLKKREESEKMRQTENIGWNGAQEEYYPKYKEKPISQFGEVDIFRKKDIINDGLLKYIDRRKEEEKVQKIDSDYQVVDTRAKKYEYKYDQGKVYIEKEEMEKMERDAKIMDKPIELPEDIKADEFKEEVIENKVQEEEKKENKEEDDEEVDGDDILS